MESIPYDHVHDRSLFPMMDYSVLWVVPYLTRKLVSGRFLVASALMHRDLGEEEARQIYAQGMTT